MIKPTNISILFHLFHMFYLSIIKWSTRNNVFKGLFWHRFIRVFYNLHLLNYFYKLPLELWLWLRHCWFLNYLFIYIKSLSLDPKTYPCVCQKLSMGHIQTGHADLTPPTGLRKVVVPVPAGCSYLFTSICWKWLLLINRWYNR